MTVAEIKDYFASVRQCQPPPAKRIRVNDSDSQCQPGVDTYQEVKDSAFEERIDNFNQVPNTNQQVTASVEQYQTHIDRFPGGGHLSDTARQVSASVNLPNQLPNNFIREDDIGLAPSEHVSNGVVTRMQSKDNSPSKRGQAKMPTQREAQKLENTDEGNEATIQ